MFPYADGLSFPLLRGKNLPLRSRVDRRRRTMRRAIRAGAVELIVPQRIFDHHARRERFGLPAGARATMGMYNRI